MFQTFYDFTHCGRHNMTQTNRDKMVYIRQSQNGRVTSLSGASSSNFNCCTPTSSKHHLRGFSEFFPYAHNKGGICRTVLFSRSGEVARREPRPHLHDCAKQQCKFETNICVKERDTHKQLGASQTSTVRRCLNFSSLGFPEHLRAWRLDEREFVALGVLRQGFKNNDREP